jgi:hypothetical protein
MPTAGKSTGANTATPTTTRALGQTKLTTSSYKAMTIFLNRDYAADFATTI